jgi:alpha-glucosidase (family GH31 glycosyl hydrolase)
MYPTNPKATEENCIIRENIRITLLTARMLRLEWAEDQVFEDRPTFMVVNRSMPAVKHRVIETAKYLEIHTDFLRLRYTKNGKPFGRSNLQIEYQHKGKFSTWKFGQKDKANLLGTLKTLDGVDGSKVDKWLPMGKHDPHKPILREVRKGDTVWVYQGEKKEVTMPPGLLSRDGWVLLDESRNVVLDDQSCDWQPWPEERPTGTRQDFYFLGYGTDYKAALAESAKVFGPQPLPPRYALGYWYSRYWAYTDKEIEQLVQQFDQYQVPLDVMVIDMDWHMLGWTGYSWDQDYFPDHPELLSWLKSKNLKITLNLHPADGVFSYEKAFPDMCREMGMRKGDLPRLDPVYDRLYELLGLDPNKGTRIPLDICDPNYMRAYFKCLHQPLEKEGVDFWWMDWQQGRAGSNLPNLDTLPWINELHWQDQVHNRPKQRPLNFSRFGGIGAGRMPVGFSGDTIVTWDSLAFQPYFTATASNVLYGYWSHDIGGHMEGKLTPELYTRWLQYGLYSPVLRTHASKNLDSERRVFEFPDPYKSVMIDALRRRYQLVPYIYSELRNTWESGVSLCHPMYYEYPDEQEAYKARDQYFYGSKMLVAPVIQPVDVDDEMAQVKVWLPEGDWFDTATGDLLKGDRVVKRRYTLEETPVFVKPGTVWVEQSTQMRLREGSYPDLRFVIYPGDKGEYTVYEDDGISMAYQQGLDARIRLSHKKTAGSREITIDPVVGDFKGFKEKRPVELQLPISIPAASVLLNGEELRWSHRGDKTGWTYNGDEATLVIRLGVVDLRKGCKVTVRYPKGVSEKLAYGIKGLMHRLEKVRRYNCLVSPARPIYAGERTAVRIAQTGNRISRAPESFKKEITTLLREVQLLPTTLKEFQKAYADRAKGKPGDVPQQVQILQKALAILDSTLRQSL